MTVKSGKKELIYGELIARGIEITDEMKKDYRKVIKALKESEGDDKAFKPVMPYEQFQWW